MDLDSAPGPRASAREGDVGPGPGAVVDAPQRGGGPVGEEAVWAVGEGG
jgi:hypothetical protein